jgi:endo-1,3-1,4-beta-glycanase ExoK
MAAVGGAPETGGASGDGFTLAWQDDFDTLDTSRWALQTFSWDGNLAQFSTENASVANGVLSIALTPEPSDTAKPYRGVELRSIPTVTYGKVEARLRFAKGSGVVSALVLIYTPWPADDWNELDIEHLGKTPDTAQLNCQVYTGPPTTPPVSQSVSPTQDPLIATLGFDAESDFHLYAIEWTPAEVRFKADGALLRTWTTEIARMKLPQNILFTIWASSTASWAGPITDDSAPTTADIDWIKVYSYAG